MRFTPHRTGDDLRKSTHSYEETTLHQAKCGNSSARHISITKIGQQIEKGRRSPTGVTSRDENIRMAGKSQVRRYSRFRLCPI